MAWTLKYTGQFKKDLKRYKHDAVKIEHLQVVLSHLEEKRYRFASLQATHA